MMYRTIKRFAQSHKKMPAYIGSVGMFNDTKTIFVSPIMNSTMYQFQRELHDYLNDFDKTGWEWYCPDRWVPHCTIALTREDEDSVFYKASDLVLREFRKIRGEFVVTIQKLMFLLTVIFYNSKMVSDN